MKIKNDAACDECRMSGEVVEVGYQYDAVWVCADCILEALDLLLCEESDSQRGVV